MSKPIKVFNKGTRPVVFKRDRTGADAIHPGKFKSFDPEKAKSIIGKFEDACTKEDYEKHLKEVAKKQASENEEAAIEAKKKAETTSEK